MPILAFLHKEPGKIESDKTERDPKKIEKLEAFRSRLKDSRIVSFWSTVNDLKTEVLTAVTNAVNLTPGIGWVRGDQAIDPKLLQEMEQLRRENESLKKQMLDQAGQEITFPQGLLGPQDNISMEIRYQVKGAKNTLVAAVTPEYALKNSINLITREVSESLLGKSLAKLFVHQNFPEKYNEVHIYRFSDESLMQMRFQLEALGLIKAESRQGETGKYIAWTLTEKGRRYIAKLFALEKAG